MLSSHEKPLGNRGISSHHYYENVIVIKNGNGKSLIQKGTELHDTKEDPSLIYILPHN